MPIEQGDQPVVEIDQSTSPEDQVFLQDMLHINNNNNNIYTLSRGGILTYCYSYSVVDSGIYVPYFSKTNS